MGALAGLGVGGAVGGLVGALVGMGIPEYEAWKHSEGRLKEGGILVSVHCETSEEVARAKDLLKATGAQDISSSGESSHGVDSKSKDAAYVNTESAVGRPAGYETHTVVKDPLIVR